MTMSAEWIGCVASTARGTASRQPVGDCFRWVGASVKQTAAPADSTLDAVRGWTPESQRQAWMSSLSLTAATLRPTRIRTKVGWISELVDERKLAAIRPTRGVAPFARTIVIMMVTRRLH